MGQGSRLIKLLVKRTGADPSAPATGLVTELFPDSNGIMKHRDAVGFIMQHGFYVGSDDPTLPNETIRLNTASGSWERKVAGVWINVGPKYATQAKWGVD